MLAMILRRYIRCAAMSACHMPRHHDKREMTASSKIVMPGIKVHFVRRPPFRAAYAVYAYARCRQRALLRFLRPPFCSAITA